MAYWRGIFSAQLRDTREYLSRGQSGHWRTNIPLPNTKGWKEKMSLVQYQVSCTAKPAMHTHTHTAECQQGVSVGTGSWGKEITLPVAQPLNEWKFDWSDFPICVCLSRLAHSECQRSDSPSHIIHVSGGRTRCGITNYWEKTQNKVLLSHKYRTRELPLISLSLELYYGCSLISERRGIRIFIILW